MAYKKESPDPATASLSLEKMTVKEFEVREMKIEAPNTTELGMLQDDLETEDDVTTDPRLLYKRFEEVWSKENKW